MDKKEQKNTNKYEVQDVATQTEPVIINNEDNSQIDVYSAIAIILNKVEKIYERVR